MAMPNKLNFSKQFIVFLVIFPLLIITSLVQVECPVCQGIGSVNNSPGMENVKIISADSICLPLSESMVQMAAMYAYMDEQTWIMNPYHVELSVVNSGAGDARGYVKLYLVDLEGNAISTENTQYSPLEVPGGTSLNVTFDISFWVRSSWFQTPEGLFTEELLGQQSKVNSEVVIENVPDAICGGTGKIPLNIWLFGKFFKGILRERDGQGAQYKVGMGSY
jgi:hypothetical protein